MTTTDYKKIAEALKPYQDYDLHNVAAAIDLCERVARGELVERAELDKHQAPAMDASWLKGYLAAYACPLCGKPCSSNGCSCRTKSAPASEASEREHCADVLVAMGAKYDSDTFTAGRIIEALMKEREAADTAGYERGLAEGRREAGEEWRARWSGAVRLTAEAEQNYERLLDANVGIAAALRALQSKHQGLVAAAREVIAKLPDERQREAANKHIAAALSDEPTISEPTALEKVLSKHSTLVAAARTFMDSPSMAAGKALDAALTGEPTPTTTYTQEEYDALASDYHGAKADLASVREKYGELAQAVDAYADCRGSEHERMQARIAVWNTRNRHVLLARTIAEPPAVAPSKISLAAHNMIMARRCLRWPKPQPDRADDILTNAINRPGWCAPELDAAEPPAVGSTGEIKQYGSYLRCHGYADCSADQKLAGCAECERVK